MPTVDLPFRKAFEAVLTSLSIAFDDLSANDNRSQFASRDRNLDYRLRLSDRVEALVEVEGRDTGRAKGRVRASEAWLKRAEVDALLDWEAADVVRRRSIVVYVFRSDEPILGRGTAFTDGQSHFMLYAILARQYAESMKVRYDGPGWQTVDLRAGEFDRLALPVAEYLAAMCDNDVRPPPALG